MNITLSDIKHWMRHGPDNERSLPRTMVANWVYWRYWLGMLTLTALFLIGGASVTGFPDAIWGYLWGFVSWPILGRVWPDDE